MKKASVYFLLFLIISILSYALTEVEHSIQATVTVNPVGGELNVLPDNLFVYAPPLSSVEKELIFWQENGNQNLNVTLFLEQNGISNWFSFSDNGFIVSPIGNKTIKVYVDIPAVGIGVYSINIHAKADDQDLVIPVNITVTDKYKINVNIDVSPRRVNAGESIFVLTKLTKSKLRKKDSDVEGKITVNLEYSVLKQKDLITTLSTTMDVIDYSEENISILIPANATSGRYTVEVTATHLDKTAKGRGSFSVTRSLFTRFFNFFGWFR